MFEKKKDEDSGTNSSVSKGESWCIFSIGLWWENYVLSVESKQQRWTAKSVVGPPQDLWQLIGQAACFSAG